MKKVLVLGGSGLLGHAIIRQLEKTNYVWAAPPHETLDVLNYKKLHEYIFSFQPDCIINAVGYTAVELAETEEEKATALNAVYPGILAEIAQKQKIYLAHFSSDYVFDGEKKQPYMEKDIPNPLCIYGVSKYSGEQRIQQQCETSCIIRSAWLFGYGKKNFVSNILALSEKQKELRVINDHLGSPTFTEDLAKATLQLMQQKAEGIFHIVNQGQGSWFHLADEAVRLMRKDCKVLPIAAADYPQKARRPEYSVLGSSEPYITEDWNSALKRYLLDTHKTF